MAPSQCSGAATFGPRGPGPGPGSVRRGPRGPPGPGPGVADESGRRARRRGALTNAATSLAPEAPVRPPYFGGPGQAEVGCPTDWTGRAREGHHGRGGTPEVGGRGQGVELRPSRGPSSRVRVFAGGGESQGFPPKGGGQGEAGQGARPAPASGRRQRRRVRGSRLFGDSNVCRRQTTSKRAEP